MNIALGPTYAYRQVEFEEPDGSIKMYTQHIALHKILNHSRMRYDAPLNRLFPDLLPFCITPNDRRIKRNIARMRNYLATIIAERKASLPNIKSNERLDVITILLENEFYKDKPDMII